jgi:hypothetical protein
MDVKRAVAKVEAAEGDRGPAGQQGKTGRWRATDDRGRYWGLHERDGPLRAETYARALWRVLALVSVPGSVHYIVLPGLRRDQLLGEPQVLASTAADRAA